MGRKLFLAVMCLQIVLLIPGYPANNGNKFTKVSSYQMYFYCIVFIHYPLALPFSFLEM